MVCVDGGDDQPGSSLMDIAGSTPNCALRSGRQSGGCAVGCWTRLSPERLASMRR